MTYKIEINNIEKMDSVEWYLDYLNKANPYSFFDSVKLYKDDKEIKLNWNQDTGSWTLDGVDLE